MELLGPATSRLLLPDSAKAIAASRRPFPLPNHRIKSSSLTTPPYELVKVLVHFLETIAKVHPLVLFLERMDCTDNTNVDNLEALLLHMNSNGNGILIVATCQTETISSEYMQQFLNRVAGNIPSASHPRANDREEAIHRSILVGPVVGSSSRVTRIHLPPLSREDVFNWTFEQAASFKCAKEKIPLVTIVIYEKSGGNPRLVRYLLCYLSLDSGSSCCSTGMTDEIDNLRTNNLNELFADINNFRTNNFNELFADINQRQSANFRAVVELVAALAESGGQEIDCNILDVVLQRSYHG